MILGLDQDLECLGRRLDAARNSLALATSPWARRHWNENYQFLLRKWNLMVAGERKIWEPYKVNRNWLTVDSTSEVISVLDKQVEAIYNHFKKQEFAVDLEAIFRAQEALATK